MTILFQKSLLCSIKKTILKESSLNDVDIHLVEIVFVGPVIPVDVVVERGNTWKFLD